MRSSFLYVFNLLYATSAFLVSCNPGVSDMPAASSPGSFVPSGVLPAEQDPKAASFVASDLRNDVLIAQLRPFMVDPNAEDAVISWNNSGSIRFLSGPGAVISLARMGCKGGEPTDSISCLFKQNNRLGVNLDQDSLQLLRTTKLKNGLTTYRFAQYRDGVRVLGSDVIATMNDELDLFMLYSHFVSALDVDLQGHSSLPAVFKDAEPSVVFADLNSLGRSPLVLSSRPIVFVDRKLRGKLGTPAYIATIRVEDERYMEVVVSAREGEIMASRDMRKEIPDQEIRTRVMYPEISPTDNCPSGYCFALGMVCSEDTWNPTTSSPMCVTMCNDDDDCQVIDPDWQCWVNDARFPGYCYYDQRSHGALESVLVYHNGWSEPEFEYLSRWADLKAQMDAVKVFHYTDLGRLSWDGNNGIYKVGLISNCCGLYLPEEMPAECEVEHPAYYAGCGAGAWVEPGVDSLVTYAAWSILAYTDDAHRSKVLRTLSHEWAHLMTYVEAGGVVPDADCIDENISDDFGRLLAVKHIGGSSTRWISQCGDNSVMFSPWGDETSGLYPGCTALPYAQRSSFDWLPCTRYGYENTFIWARFMRVLAEGSGTFAVDGNGEDVGVTLAGIGWAATTDVIYTAMTNITTSTTLKDWVGLLRGSGLINGHYDEVNKALGIVGFMNPPILAKAGESDRAPFAVEFTSWALSSSKEFQIWKDRTTYDLKVKRHDGTVWVTDTIAANTDSGPTAVEYNSFLHIFWRDRLTGGIKLEVYDSMGTIYGPFDLTSKGITTLGAFDSTVFNGHLYLVYASGVPATVNLSWCSSRVYCSTFWHDFDPDPSVSVYKKSLGYTAHAGLAVDAGPDMSITEWPAPSCLFIASSSDDLGPNHMRIRVDLVNSSDNVVFPGYPVWIPETNLSNATNQEIGLRMVRSAFPRPGTTDPMNYLYLTWKDPADTRIYKAIVRAYHPLVASISSTNYTYIDSNFGVRWKKGDGPAVSAVKLMHVNTSNKVVYGELHGRY